MMTVIVSFTLAILLYAFLGFRETTHPLIYATAGLLLAMGAWHIQTFIRTRRLKKQWKTRMSPVESEPIAIGSPMTGKQLDMPDFENMVPASVTDRTTKHLSEKPRSSQS
jgi:cytochrome c biogenesis protein CcdA